MNDQSLATELLMEVKNSARRWFVAFCIMVIVECFTVIGFIWYLTLPVEEYRIEQEADERSFNIINSGQGDVINGRTTDTDLQAESGTQ